MKSISHEDQKRIWEEEHARPQVLLQMDSTSASSGVEHFCDWLSERGHKCNKIIEFGCGKGRNVIWLASKGFDATGIDFSPSAITEAIRRTEEAGVADKAHFLEHDVTELWPFPDNSFDGVIDCFAMTDVDSLAGRKFASQEAKRILRPSDVVLVYALSTEDGFHRQMIEASPTEEKNSFTHPSTGKFEKAFERSELIDLWSGLKLIEERRVSKTATYFGKEYQCNHHWMVFEKQ